MLETPIDVRTVTRADSAAIVALDAEITETDKSAYWADILDRFAGADKRLQRYLRIQ